MRKMSGHEIVRQVCGAEYGSRSRQCKTFPVSPLTPMISIMDNVTLPPELERFAAEAVAAGRYRDVSEVVRAGLSLLQRAEAEVAEFVVSLEEARAEGERDGFLNAEQVEQRVRAIVEVAAARRG